MVHRVKSHRWNRGVLETLEYFFDSEKTARTFATQVKAHTVKIINDDNEVIDIRTVTFDKDPVSDYSGADSDYSGADLDEDTYA
jgi:hypothetical protein